MNNILRQRADQKAVELEEADQSCEAKHARAMAKLNNQMQPRVLGVRYVGPKEPGMSDVHRSFVRNRSRDMGISRCRWCDPEPETWTCPACDHVVDARWKMKTHNISNPRWCQDRAAKKARQWSRQA